MKEKSEGYELELTQDAISDIQAGYNWHSEEEPTWGEAFLLEVEETLELIRYIPQAFPNKYKDYRECNLERYPYTLVYTIKEKSVIVHSVFHENRDPGEKYPE